MEKLKNNKKIIIIIGVIILIIISIYVLTKIDEYNYEENNYEEYFAEEENIIKEEAKKVIVVHIIGEINKPGIVELEEGARVIDAIKKAGGTTEKADLAQINLAYILKDGQKIYIPNTEDNDKKIEYNTANIENNIKEEKININTADEDELQRLPGVGASTAAKIIKYREENGSFRKIEDIQNVKGIGEAKYNDLKEQIEV
ncbi:MAG: helix-hairpin-helix domain-containing protein [Clostridia bacterium]|nr:competence protein ComEA [Clostridiales bacterium]